MKTTTRFLGTGTLDINRSQSHAYLPTLRPVKPHVVELTKREVALTLLDWQEKAPTLGQFTARMNSFLDEQALSHTDVRHLMAKFSRRYP